MLNQNKRVRGKTIKNMKYIAVLVLALGLLSGCSRKVSDEELRAARAAVSKGAMIIDVRSKKEYNRGYIEGAVNIPIDVLDKVYRGIPKEKELVVYCRTGSRSMVAARLLREQGWTVYDVVNQEQWERELQ